MAVDWADVYRRTYVDLVRFLHRLVWDADQAQDLAQEAFARALGQAPENPRAWRFRGASNLANDEARSAIRRKKHLVLIKGESETQQDMVSDPHSQLEQQERITAVRKAHSCPMPASLMPQLVTAPAPRSKPATWQIRRP